MRLIGQRGDSDIPYDKAILYVYELPNAWQVRAMIDNREYILAEYSTYEKARNEMLAPATILAQWNTAYLKPDILSSMPGYIPPAPQIYIFKQEKSQEEMELIKTALEQSI